MKVTCDSNVLVYTVDAENSVKRTRAQDIVARTARQNGILTLQALAEFYNVSTKRRLGAGDDPERLVKSWSALFSVHPASSDSLRAAIEAAQRHNIAFWDAMLWASAAEAGCELLLSEDFQDGRKPGPVTIVNPFDPKNDALIDGALPPTSPST